MGGDDRRAAAVTDGGPHLFAVHEALPFGISPGDDALDRPLVFTAFEELVESGA